MTIPPFRADRLQRANSSFGGRAGKEILLFPLPVPQRLALIDVDFRLTANMRYFGAGDTRGLADFAPDAVGAPLSLALSLADQNLRGLLELPSLKLAVVIFWSLGSDAGGPVAPHHRDLLWKAFGLPVFEQLRGWDGRVIARECEVHDGLHFDAHAVTMEVDRKGLAVMGTAAGFAAEIERGQCECGLETPRLRPVNAAKMCAAAA